MARILLIEDDSSMLETLSLAMRSKGHEVLTARNGEEGIGLFSAGRFDAVVTDIIMPGIDGLGLIDEIRHADPDTKILAISGGGMLTHFDFLEAAKRHGARAVLEKPFRVAELNDLLDQCILSGKMTDPAGNQPCN